MNTSFGKYELVDKIGTGGMAEVYLARSYGAAGLQKSLVIKRILPEHLEHDRFIDMFISEAKIAVQLNHPNIVQIYDFGKVDDDFYLAMEYVDGYDLANVIEACRQADKPLSVGEAVYIAIEVATGLSYAHQRKDQFGDDLDIVHRDISPQNILVSSDGTVKIVDFGIAKATSVADDGPGVVKGKFSYMSPEQARGEAIDHRSDLFSLGVVLFELVCGRPLFRQTTREETLSLVKSAVVPDICNLNADVPEPLEHLLYKVLACEPDQRFQSARDLQVELTRLLYSLGEIHDAVTLSKHLREVEAHAEGPSGAKVDPAGTVETDVLAHRSSTTADMDTDVVDESNGNDPATVVTEQRPIRSGPHLLARERKEVVVVAGEVIGLLELRSSSTAQSRWLQVLQEYTRIVDSIAFKNDGVVHRVNENDFVIVLGIPVSSENDAERGVRVAMDLHEAIAGMSFSLDSPLQLAIGAGVAEVIVERENDDDLTDFEWSFFDSTHDIALRLSGAAMAKEVLLGGQVFRRVRREYECEGVDQIHFEDAAGQPRSLRPHRLVGRKSQGAQLDELRQSYRTFRGRELPLRVLRTNYRQTLLRGEASGVLITGEMGIGKSTLVEEFLSGLAPRDVRVVRAVITPLERDVPLSAMADFLTDMMRLGPRDDLRQLRETLRTRVEALFPDEDDAERELLLHSVGSIFNVKYSGSRFRELDGEERRTRKYLSISKILLRFAERKPIILAVEDAQNLDESTIEFASQFLSSRRDAPIFMIATINPSRLVGGGPSRPHKAFADVRNLTVEHLGELNGEDARSLVKDLLHVHGVFDQGLVDEVLLRSGGNPMFIKEVIDVLRDRGLLDDPDQLKQLEAQGDNPQWLPASVEGLIGARIDGLKVGLKAVIQKVSLLWTPFSVADANLMVDQSPVDELDGLVRLDLLERADHQDISPDQSYDAQGVPVDQRSYRFCNALTQEVASRSLLPDEARRLHRDIARHLVDRVGDHQLADYAMIAKHFDGAGDTDRAVEYYKLAAEDAFRDFGAAECLRLCTKVVERVDDDSQVLFDILMLRERATVELGQVDQRRQTLERLEELAMRIGSPHEQIDVLLREARFHVDDADFGAAQAHLDRAREIAGQIDSQIGLADSYRIEVMILVSQGNRHQAHRLIQKAIDIFQAHHGDESIAGLAACHNLRGVLLRQSGHHRQALDAYEQALVYAERGDLSHQIRLLLINTGVALVYNGEFSEAVNRYQRAIEQARQLGHRRDEASGLVNLGHAYYVLGQVDRAVSKVQRGIFLARKTGDNGTIADGQISLGLCYLARRDLEAADHALHEGLRLADSIPNVYLSIHATVALAEVQLAGGSADDARIALMQAEDALERARAAGMSWRVAYAHSQMARALRMLGRRQQAIEASQKAVEVIDGGEIYAMDEILYHHTRILPDGDEYLDDKKEAIGRARDFVNYRRDRIDDDTLRASYMDRDLNRKIMNVSMLLLGRP